MRRIECKSSHKSMKDKPTFEDVGPILWNHVDDSKPLLLFNEYMLTIDE